MINRVATNKSYWKEILFQIILHVVVFVFFSFDKRDPRIDIHQIAFFANYAAAAFIINYILLPRFYYQKKYLGFFVAVLLIFGAVIMIEEFVLEKIYFPDTKGKRFSGFFYTLLDVLPVITILSGFKFAWDALRKQSEVDVLKSAVRESELQFLKSQINPHFLFNNLNNLYAYSIDGSPKTPEIILELSGVLRYMLYECKEKYVPLTKEIKQLENFINLSELQIEERGEITFASKNIESGYFIAPLILIVFIENAFKHSTASQSEGIKIDIQVELKKDDVLYFYCTNSFLPTSNTDQLSYGIGLENVKKRLELLYPDAHQLTIKNEGNLYQVALSMKLHKS